MVFIPYCTGDLHIGSAKKTYANANTVQFVMPDMIRHPWIADAETPDPIRGRNDMGKANSIDANAGNPYIPATFDIQHRGFDNFMVVFDWMKKNVDRPKNVLVTGASAGGYGATANFPWIERAFRNAHTYVVADASQGVTTPTWDRYGRSSWNIRLAPWVFGDNPAAIAGPDLMRVAAEALPQVKTAQHATAYDSTQNYLAEGTEHTLLRSDKFYTEDSAGVHFSAWLGNMLANRGGTGGHGGNWENVACESCLLQLPCPAP